jgi:hypothetical protein
MSRDLQQVSLDMAPLTERNLSVADQPGDIVGPRGHRAENFCGFAGYVWKRIGV